MAQVGTITCDFVHGDLPRTMRQRVDTWSTPGVPGLGSQQVGQQGTGFTLELVRFGTEGVLNLWGLQLDALVGTVVSIIDDHGQTHTNCLIADLSNPSKRPARYHVPGGSGSTKRSARVCRGFKVGA